jgi:hypothetical protein
MKNSAKFFVAALVMLVTSLVVPSCTKKGDDDPVVSLKSRKDRFTNTWTLTKYEINGQMQDLNGTSYVYEVNSSGTLKRTVEGTLFGFQTKTVKDGTWEFVNDEEDVKITIDGSSTTYNVQRLASKELWIKEIKGSDTHMYYFEAK